MRRSHPSAVTSRSARGPVAAILLLLLTTLACGDSQTGPEPEPANVVITAVARGGGTSGAWEIVLDVENTGGDGAFRIRTLTQNCETRHVTRGIDAGESRSDLWTSGCTNQPEEVVVETLVDGALVETDRAPIP